MPQEKLTIEECGTKLTDLAKLTAQYSQNWDNYKEIATGMVQQAYQGGLGDRKVLVDALRGGNANKDNAELMEFVADRLVNEHGESDNVDFVLALRERAAMIRKALGDD